MLLQLHKKDGLYIQKRMELRYRPILLLGSGKTFLRNGNSNYNPIRVL